MSSLGSKKPTRRKKIQITGEMEQEAVAATVKLAPQAFKLSFANDDDADDDDNNGKVSVLHRRTSLHMTSSCVE
jgi:hypothetical protein